MDHIKSLILTWDEYRAKKFEVPYMFEITKSEQRLMYIGVRHLYLPEDKQFPVIEQKFEEFAHQQGNKVVLVEGGNNWPTFPTAGETIQKYGEAAYTTFLAKEAGLEFNTPEPEFADSLALLKEAYSIEQISSHWVATYGLHYSKIVDKPSQDEYIQNRILKKLARISDVYKTVDDVKNLHRKLFNTELDLNEQKFFYDLVDPSQNNSVYNEMSRAEDVIRDSTIVKNILDYWNRGYSVFIVYGSAHAVNQERALNELCV